MSSRLGLDFLNVQSWGKGLLELVRLLRIGDDKGVQVAAAANLELDVLLSLHDLHTYQKARVIWCYSAQSAATSEFESFGTS